MLMARKQGRALVPMLALRTRPASLPPAPVRAFARGGLMSGFSASRATRHEPQPTGGNPMPDILQQPKPAIPTTTTKLSEV